MYVCVLLCFVFCVCLSSGGCLVGGVLLEGGKDGPGFLTGCGREAAEGCQGEIH